jgi:8-oxo-dGTP diphosphatase
MTEVVAAILERDGRVLIGQRRAGQSHALKWEFPGGKVEPGETPQQALARELQEELSITGARGGEMLRYEFAYPGKAAILLIFFRIDTFEGDPRNLIYEALHWAPREELPAIDFLEGDRRFLNWYCAGLSAPASL